MKRPFKSNTNLLMKSRNMLSYSKNMAASTVILSDENEQKRKLAIDYINQAINLLNDIK